MLLHRCCLALFLLATLSLSADPVLVSRGPGSKWVPKDTRTLADLSPIKADPPSAKFGGILEATHPATGFFHTKKIGDRWWLIDPQGHPYLHRGVTSLKMLRTSGARESLLKQFGSREKWAADTTQLLLDHGFNGLGPWCDKYLFPSPQVPIVHTKIWNFMSIYGRKRGGVYQASGHTGYPEDCPFIFDPEFPAFCLEHAKQLADTKDDPWLLGHFTDNELPWRLEMLENYLKLPSKDPGHLAAKKWLTKRHGPDAKNSDITEKDREDFLAFAADIYFAAVTTAIHKHDPNHLILGSRFHGRANKIPVLFEAAGRHLDVISVNYYHAWTPDLDLMKTWETKSQKPVLISEWYAKAQDSGLANTSGAGWLVKTQKDRAAFYQNFTLALLESQSCIGWHWFRYSDNDPKERGRDPSNLDANKGIVTNRYKPYQELLGPMKDLNQRAYSLIKHFDQ